MFETLIPRAPIKRVSGAVFVAAEFDLADVEATTGFQSQRTNATRMLWFDMPGKNTMNREIATAGSYMLHM